MPNELNNPYVHKNSSIETRFAVRDSGLKPLTTVINCKTIILAQDSIGVEIEITEAFKRTNTIIVNGVEFERRANDE